MISLLEIIDINNSHHLIDSVIFYLDTSFNIARTINRQLEWDNTKSPSKKNISCHYFALLAINMETLKIYTLQGFDNNNFNNFFKIELSPTIENLQKRNKKFNTKLYLYSISTPWIMLSLYYQTYIIENRKDEFSPINFSKTIY